jgi:prepilin-type N-terminal cleavage/methylation domain-containing protein
MRDDVHGTTAFTLVELLVVITILGILAVLIFPALSAATSKGRRASCLSNLKQIDQGVMMYAADNHDILFPFVKNPDHPNREEPHNPNWGLSTFEWTAYVPLVGRYVGWKGDPSPQNKLFACPADTFQSCGVLVKREPPFPLKRELFELFL